MKNKFYEITLLVEIQPLEEGYIKHLIEISYDKDTDFIKTNCNPMENIHVISIARKQ